MADLYSMDKKSIEKDYTITQPTEELDKLNDESEPEEETSSIVLILFAFIPMIILILLFNVGP